MIVLSWNGFKVHAGLVRESSGSCLPGRLDRCWSAWSGGPPSGPEMRTALWAQIPGRNMVPRAGAPTVGTPALGPKFRSGFRSQNVVPVFGSPEGGVHRVGLAGRSETHSWPRVEVGITQHLRTRRQHSPTISEYSLATISNILWCTSAANNCT